MSKIYVSYTARDDDFARELMEILRLSGHEITVEGTRLTAGVDWRSVLNQCLKSADVFIIVISKSTMHSQYPMMELGIARAYAENSGKILILPIIIGDLTLPTFVQDIQVIFACDRRAEELLPEINRAISAFEGKRVAQEVEQQEIAEAVRSNLAEYVNEAIFQQNEAALKNKKAARFWYFLGYAALVFGLTTTAFLAFNLINSQTQTADYAKSISLSFLNIIAIALLAALARYAYSLGKSYMSESLKSSDRIHAIQFGKFFLRAYGAKASTAEIKEVFQHWNIDRTSTFSLLDPSQIDPQIINMVIQVISALTGKANK